MEEADRRETHETIYHREHFLHGNRRRNLLVSLWRDLAMKKHEEGRLPSSNGQRRAVKTIIFKHWVSKKKAAAKLCVSTLPNVRPPRITLEIWEGREQYGKKAWMEIGEALLLADWLRETALGLLKEQAEIVQGGC
jgi:hypothetical protein